MLLLATVEGQLIPKNKGGVAWFKMNSSSGGFSPTLSAGFEQITSPEAIIVGEDEVAKYMNLMGEYSGDTLMGFQNVVRKRIDDLHAPGADLGSRENFHTFQLVSLLAMVTLRALSKDEVAVRNGYSKKQFRNNISSLIGVDSAEGFHPPCKKCIRVIFTSFSSGPSIGRKMIALLVKCLIDNTGPTCNSYISGVLSASCLMHLSRTGLGLV